LAEYEMS